MVAVLLVGFAGGDIGQFGDALLLIGAEVEALPDSEEGVVGISGFVISEDDEGLVECSVAQFVKFRFEVVGQLCVGLTDGGLSGTARDLQSLVVVDCISGDSGGKAKGSRPGGDPLDEVCQHYLHSIYKI